MNVFSKVFIAGALAFTSLASHAVAQEEKTYNVTAEQLYQEFDENQLKADKKYEEARIIIKGFVYRVREGFGDRVHVELYGDKSSLPIIDALLDEDAKSKAVDLNKDDEVTLDCIGAEKPHIVKVYNCLIE